MRFFLTAVILIVPAVFIYAAENSDGNFELLQNPEFTFWYDLIGSDYETMYSAAVSAGFSNTPVEISPEKLGSSADRIIWFADYTADYTADYDEDHNSDHNSHNSENISDSDLTVWLKPDVVQLRFGSGIKGTIAGIGIGSSPEEVISLCGPPWIEDGSSLYYNLPWRGGPVRLRLVFEDYEQGGEGLFEVYLYQVR